MLGEILDFVSKMPAGLWTLLSALIALAGVLLTMNIQGRRLARQFKHEKELKDREREMLMRKEIFLSTAEAFAAGLQSLPKFADTTISNHEVAASFQEKSLLVARLYVIASTRTVSSVIAVMDELALAHMKLSALRQDLLIEDHKLNTFVFLRQRQEKERDDMLELHKNNHLNLQDDPNRKARIDASFIFYRDSIDEILSNERTTWGKVQNQKIAILREGHELRVAVLKKMLPAVSSLREELQLPGNEAQLHMVLSESLRKMDEPAKEFLKNLEVPQ